MREKAQQYALPSIYPGRKIVRKQQLERKEAGKSTQHEENDRENLPEEKNEDLEDGIIDF